MPTLTDYYYQLCSATLGLKYSLWNHRNEPHLVSHMVIDVFQLLNCVLLFVTPRTATDQASLSFTISQNLCKLLSSESMYHPNISSPAIPFSSYPEFFPASGSFPKSWIFASGGQSIGISASVSVLPMNTQDWWSLGWTGLISLLSKGLSRVYSRTSSLNYKLLSQLSKMQMFIHYLNN